MLRALAERPDWEARFALTLATPREDVVTQP